MRISDVIRLGQEYLLLGIIMAAAVLLLFAAGYFFIYKKLLKGEKTVRFWNLFWGALLVCYVVVVLGATMFSRTEAPRGNIRLQPFASYRYAWNSFSERDWRNLILNILMFVPFGFMLPLVFQSFRIFWKTYLAGFLFTLLIEVSQILFQRGVFELDDIMNNLLGAIIGYGFYRLFHWLIVHFRKNTVKERFRPVLLLQLPLILTIGAFGGIFLIYHFQELGNLSSSYTLRYNPDRLKVETEVDLSEEEESIPVYQMYIASIEETHDLAENFFEQFGCGIDESRTDYYDDTVIYYNDEQNLSLWIDYAGSKMDFTNFDKLFDESYDGVTETKDDASEGEVLDALKKIGIEPPEGVTFENKENGSYLFTAVRIAEGEVLYNGVLSCTLTADGEIVEMNDSIITYEKYKDFEILSEQNAYDQICTGRFRCYPEQSTNVDLEVDVHSVRLVYETDSKGFFQPVYVFDTDINKKAASIRIPAISR